MKKNFILPFFWLFIMIGATACRREKTQTEFSRHPLGYYYKLISFDLDNSAFNQGKVCWVSASFKTQSDSVFWDSFNNLNDKFYLRNDSAEKTNFLKQHIFGCSDLDSVCLLIPTKVFFRQQFRTESVPFFSTNDSVVRVNFKIKKIYNKEDFVKIKHNLKEKEEKQIKRYFGTSAEMEAARDPLGFYWVDRSGATGTRSVQAGDNISVAYKGEYLNGRFLEKSGDDFEFIYGTPDQVLKGLNYVIGRLKMGENAKIILPSQLAFGEDGSSNGTVPPFTPLVYEIQLIDLKTNEKAP